MIRFALITACLCALPLASFGDTVTAKRTIRAQSILTAEDVQLIVGDVPGTLISLSEAVGQEARTVLYAGRPIRLSDIGPPAVINRNQIVPLTYINGSLRISADARSLSRAGVGDTVRVMNLTSKTIVTGYVGPQGGVYVGSLPTR